MHRIHTRQKGVAWTCLRSLSGLCVRTSRRVHERPFVASRIYITTESGTFSRLEQNPPIGSLVRPLNRPGGVGTIQQAEAVLFIIPTY